MALFQANLVGGLLKERGFEIEIIPITTKGDVILDVSIAKIGSKGVFTEEIEEQLEAGTIDIAVHSAKDMQSILPDGFELIAFTEREKVNDIILSHHPKVDYENPEVPLVLGTSAARRVATLKHFYPHIRTVEVRGNLQTRIGRMESGVCDALLLAYAGVHRMEYDQLIRNELPLDKFIPAVGQGSIAVEVATSLDPALRKLVVEAVHHEETGYRLSAERSYLRVLEGGCSIPVFALGTINNGMLRLQGGIVSLDGKERIVHEISGKLHQAVEIGQQLAEKVLASGGDHILTEIKKSISNI